MPEIIRKRKEGEPMLLKNGPEKVVAKGHLGAIVQFPILLDTGQGYVEKTFEKLVRPPGARLIATRDGKIFLNKERRLEADNDFDWRLPGGKVFDSLDEFLPYLEKEIDEKIILQAGAKELKEEAGLVASNLKLLEKRACGASVEWDLYYILAEDFIGEQDKHQHDEGEEISDSGWFSFGEIFEMMKQGVIQEGRTVAVLLKFINSK